MTEIGRRVHDGLVVIDGEMCTKTKARKATTCVASRRPINPGDMIYRPLGNSPVRSARWLASYIEERERAQKTADGRD